MKYLGMIQMFSFLVNTLQTGILDYVIIVRIAKVLPGHMSGRVSVPRGKKGGFCGIPSHFTYKLGVDWVRARARAARRPEPARGP